MKKMLFVSTLILAIPFFAGGCAHSHTKGSVVLTDSVQDGHVCLDDDKIKVGEKVAVSQEICTQGKRRVGRRGRLRICNDAPLGEAEVIDTTNVHFAKIRAIDNLTLRPGQKVVRKN